MPNFFSRFGKLWGSTGNLQDPTDAQANAGWSYIGQAPPTVEQFNSTHQWWDAKDNWLFSQIDAVIQQAGMTSAATPVTTLRDAILTFFRKYLTSPLTLYIDVLNGDDTLGDGSNAKPWRTIQFAINYLYNKVDGGGQNIFIQLKVAGTYAPVFMRGFFNGTITIVGDVLNKRSYIIKNTAGPAINLDASALIALKGISLEGLGSGGDYGVFGAALIGNRGSIFLYDQIAFGPCTKDQVYMSQGAVFYPSNGTSTTYEIYGGGEIHLACDTSGICTVVGITTTVTAASAFSVAFAYAGGSGVINCWNWNIVNKASVTGTVGWNASYFGLIATKANLALFPIGVGYPTTIGTLPTSGAGVGGLIS